MASFQETFNTVCSKPATPYHFVQSADIRGTLDILWASLTALLLCTYSVQHLAIPADEKPKNWKERFRDVMRSLLTKPFYMLLTLLAPEAMIGIALMDYFSARTSEKEMEVFAREDQVEWTICHAFYANMSGFILRFPSSFSQEDKAAATTTSEPSLLAGLSLPDSENPTTHTSESAFKDNLTIQPQPLPPKTDSGDIEAQTSDRPVICADSQRFYVNKCDETLGYECPIRNKPTNAPYKYVNLEHVFAHSGPIWNGNIQLSRTVLSRSLATQPDNNEAVSRAIVEYLGNHYNSVLLPKLFPLRGQEWTMDARQILLARKYGIIEKLPFVTESEIRDQSKGDTIVKVISICQILYLIIQLCMRKSQRLASTHLEVMVVAFAACALVIYCCYLAKPQDVKYSRHIEASRYPNPTEIIDIGVEGPSIPLQDLYYNKVYGLSSLSTHWCGDLGLPPFLDMWPGSQIWVVGGALGGATFGSIHCLAWNFEFPTSVERLLWRISCISILVIPFFGPVALYKLSNMLFRALTPTLRDRRDISKSTSQAKQAAIWAWKLLNVVMAILLVLVIWGAGALYFLARLYMVCEVFRALFYLPPTAFLTTTWFSSIPHIG